MFICVSYWFCDLYNLSIIMKILDKNKDYIKAKYSIVLKCVTNMTPKYEF